MLIANVEKLDFVPSALRTLCAWICELLYPLIAALFQLFIDISQIMVLTEENYKVLYNRITIFLSTIMVFYITLEFIKYLVQPDTLTDKEKGAGSIGKKVIIVVVLIGFTPTIFSYAWKLQNYVIQSDVLSKIILGREVVSSNQDFKIGNSFSTVMLNQFYSYNNNDEETECEKNVPCLLIVRGNLGSLLNDGNLRYLNSGLNAATTGAYGDSKEPLITFNGLMAVGVGAFIAYILILYAVDVAKRIFQLTFLQIIAPIPIMGYLSPKKDNIFTKWIQQCITTYLDLFIRLILIYFVLLMSSMISKAYNSGDLFNNIENQTSASWLIYVALIMGLLLFVQKLPKIIEELFPKMGSAAASGNFGLKPGERNLGQALGAALGLTAGTAVGAATGLAQGLRKLKSDPDAKFGKKAWNAISGAVGGTIRGGLGGAGRGLSSGIKKGNPIKNVTKGVSDQIKSNTTYGNKAEAGYTMGKQIQDKLGETFGSGNRKQQLENKKAPNKRQLDALKEEESTNKAMRQRAEDKVREGKGKYSGTLAAAEKRVRDFKEDPTIKQKYMRREATEESKAAQRAAAASVRREDFVGRYATKAEADAAKAQKTAEAERLYDKSTYRTRRDFLEEQERKYQADVQRARDSVDVKQFIGERGVFNQAAYEKACDEATNKIKKPNYQIYRDKEVADKAYQQAVTNAKNSIDKNSYMGQNGVLDESAYEKACNEAASKVDRRAFVVAYGNKETANKAYQADVQRARDSVDVKQFIGEHGAFDQTAYEKACDEAASKIKADDYQVIYGSESEANKAREKDISAYVGTAEDYKTNEEAQHDYEAKVQEAVDAVHVDYTETLDEKAFEEDYQKAMRDADAAKKLAIDDFIDNGAESIDENGNKVYKKDDAIVNMITTANAKRSQYNLYSDSQHKIAETVTVERDGRKVEVKIENLTAAEFDDYVKKQRKAQEDEVTRRNIELDAEIASIERQTSGSSNKN